MRDRLAFLVILGEDQSILVCYLNGGSKSHGMIKSIVVCDSNRESEALRSEIPKEAQMDCGLSLALVQLHFSFLWLILVFGLVEIRLSFPCILAVHHQQVVVSAFAFRLLLSKLYKYHTIVSLAEDIKYNR